MVTIKKRRLYNPQRAAKRSLQAKASQRRKRQSRPNRTNPGLYTIGFVNPTQRTPMKNKEKKKQYRKSARRPNPAVSVKRHRGCRRRNPIRPVGMLKTGTLALAGLVATRQLPQLVLGQRNTGIVGYIANALAAALSALVAGKLGDRQAGQAVLIGGSLYLVNRVLSEQFSPVGKLLAMSGVGDAQASASLGAIRPAYIPYPVQYDQAGKPIIPPAIIEAVNAAKPPALPSSAVASVAGVGRLGSRF